MRPRPLLRLAVATLLLALALPLAARAQRHHTPQTLAFDPAAPRPPATLADMAWLVGHWRGEALGGTSEELWSPPFGGAMMGMYKLVRQDTIVFYEFLTVLEEAGSLVLRLKHFNPDLTGWEEQNEVRSFPLVQRTEARMYFDGMTFEPHGADSLVVFLAIDGGGGPPREATFAYRRVRE